MISDLNAPLPSVQPKSFSDLICRKLPPNITDAVYDILKNDDPTDPPNINDIPVPIRWYLNWLGERVLNQKNNPYKEINCFSLYSSFYKPPDNID